MRWSCSGESTRARTVLIFQNSKSPTSVRLRIFLIQALVERSTSDGAGILDDL